MAQEYTLTDYHEFKDPSFGAKNYEEQWTDNLEALDTRVPKTGAKDDRPPAGTANRIYVATDDGAETFYLDTGDQWVPIAGQDMPDDELRIDEIHADDGSASDPSYSFDSDTSTGMYAPSGASVRVTVQGTHAATLDSDQNLILPNGGITSAEGVIIDTGGLAVAGGGASVSDGLTVSSGGATVAGDLSATEGQHAFGKRGVDRHFGREETLAVEAGGTMPDAINLYANPNSSTRYANLTWYTDADERMFKHTAHPEDDHFSMYARDQQGGYDGTQGAWIKKMNIDFGSRSEGAGVQWRNIDAFDLYTNNVRFYNDTDVTYRPGSRQVHGVGDWAFDYDHNNDVFEVISDPDGSPTVRLELPDAGAPNFPNGLQRGGSTVVVQSRFPLPDGDLSEDYALTSRFPIPNSDLQNSTLSVAGNSVGLGGSTPIASGDLSDSGDIAHVDSTETLTANWDLDSGITLNGGRYGIDKAKNQSVVMNLNLTGNESQGDQLYYDFAIGGNTVWRTYGESDGAGSLQTDAVDLIGSQLLGWTQLIPDDANAQVRTEGTGSATLALYDTAGDEETFWISESGPSQSRRRIDWKNRDALNDSAAALLQATEPAQPSSGIATNNSPRYRMHGHQIDASGATSFTRVDMYVQPDDATLGEGYLDIEVGGGSIAQVHNDDQSGIHSFGDYYTRNHGDGLVLYDSFGGREYAIKRGTANSEGDSDDLWYTNRTYESDTVLGTNTGSSGAEIAALRLAWGDPPTVRLQNGADLEDSAQNTVYDDANNEVPAARQEGGESLEASGVATLSSGAATVPTGITTTGTHIDVRVDPSGNGANSADVKVAARAFWDNAAGEYKVEILEDGTSVGNPDVGYEVYASA